MTTLQLQGVTKRFGTFEALRGIDLDLPSGKMITFLGPSGSGKSTLFRLVAGLDEATAGLIRFDGRDVTRVPAYKRNVGMVFQNYALFPHLNVWENIAYGLSLRGVSKAERRKRALELLELIKLPDIADRAINQLSGGQRQRVAIARALAVQPDLFLLDEPLSALDAKLREHMQNELCALQRAVGVTTIVVTHDQREAMTMSDVIVVIDQGRVHQVGSPLEIYRKPATPFVADFVGTSTLLPGNMKNGGQFSFEGGDIRLDSDLSGHGLLCLRPERLTLHAEGVPVENSVSARVDEIRDLGSETEIFVQVGPHRVAVKDTSVDASLYAKGSIMRLCIPRDTHLIRPEA